MKKALAILLASLIVHPLFLPSLVAAATRFADPGGSGSTCSIGSPCTFNTALSLSTGGDTINMRAGSYPQITDVSGWPSTSSGAPLTIQCYQGESVVVSANDGPSLNQTQTSTAWTTFSCIKFVSTGNFNEVVGLQGNNLTFLNVEATANDAVVTEPNSANVVLINSAAHDILISGGEFHNPGSGPGCGIFSCFGYTFYVTGDNITIEHAKIHDGQAYLIHNFKTPAVNASNNTFRYNEIYNGCGTLTTCAAILLGTGSGLQAYGNIIHDITGSGVGDISCIHIGNGSSNASAYNNDCNGAKFASISWDDSSSGAVVKNNALSNSPRDFYNTSQDNNASPPGGSVSNNRCEASDSRCSTTGATGYVNAGAGDYSLLSTSAMIGQGVTSIRGGIDACKNGANPDIGAIQTLANPVVQVNGTAFTIGYTNNCTDQMLPSAPTGFSFLKNGVNDAISSIARTSANVFSGILANAFVFNNTCNYSYPQSSGNVVSNNNIGNTGATNQEAFTVTNAACTNNTPPGSLNLVKILLGTVGMRMGNGKSVNAGLIP